MKFSIHPRVYQAVGFLGLVVATLLAMWLLATGRNDHNQVFTVLGYILAVVGILPAMLIVKPPLRRQDF